MDGTYNANKDEAEEGIKMGIKYLQQNNIDRALKIFLKCEKMYPHETSKFYIKKIYEMKSSNEKRNQTSQEAKEDPKENINQEKRNQNESTKSKNVTNDTTNSNNTNDNSTTNSETKIGRDGRTYTSEDEKEVMRILKSESFYAILNCSENSSANDIRKCYKKIVVKIHPDKNAHKDSPNAFKLVSSAYNCLSNDSERKRYDKLGHEIFTNQRSSSNVSNRNHQNQQYYYQDDISPEDLFDMFFNPHRQRNGFRARNVYTYDFRPRYQTRDNNPQANRYQILQAIMAILFFVFFVFSGSIFKPKPEPFSLEMTYYHRYGLTTKIGLPFYVNQEIEDKIRKDPEEINKLENSVNSEYKDYFTRACYQEKKNFQYHKMWDRNYQARLENCELKEKYFPSKS